MGNHGISRMEFLKQTGAVLGGLVMGSAIGGSLSSCSKTRSPLPLGLPKDEIRLGIIGTGQRWVEQLTQSLEYLPNYRVTGCADINPYRLEQGLSFADKGAKGYKDYRSLLDNKDIDAVIVCTPLVSHFQIAADAISAGKHVSCEKSMAYSIGEAVELERIVYSNPRLAFRVSHEFRHEPAINRIRELVQNNGLGKITHMEGKWDSFDPWRRVAEDPEYDELVNWRLRRKYCGGLMTEKVSHVFDMANYILDAHPVKATSSGSIMYWKDERDTYDNVQTIFEYPGGIHGVFSANIASHYDGGYLKIYGEKATAEYHIGVKGRATITPNPKFNGSREEIDAVTGASIKIIKKSDKKLIRCEDEVYDSYNDLMYSYYAGTVMGYRHFSRMIVHGEAPDITVSDGKNTSISALMANLSNRNMTVETWKPEYGK